MRLIFVLNAKFYAAYYVSMSCVLVYGLTVAFACLSDGDDIMHGGGYALVTLAIVKVIFCNGVIGDSDCEGSILKGIINLPQLFVRHLLCTRCCVEPSD